MTASKVPRLYTVTQVAELTGVPAWRIYDLLKQGKIKHVVIGRTKQIPETAIAEWITAEERHLGDRVIDLHD